MTNRSRIIKFLQEFNEHTIGGVPLNELFALSSLIVLYFVFIVWIAIHKESEWQKFAIRHKCKVVGHISGSVSPGFGYGVSSKGNPTFTSFTVVEPDRTVYDCNDGMRYTR